MQASENLWIAVAIALALGIVIGIILTQLARRVSGGSTTGTQAQLESLQLRFEEYQQDVSSHFKTTANLVSRLNRSYQDIQEHLTQGAMDLSPDDMTRQRLLAALEEQSGPSMSTRTSSEPVFDSLEPPRDYAPKMQDMPGTLSENYGIKRKP